MQWFKHDTDAATYAKIKKLVMRYGAEEQTWTTLSLVGKRLY